VRGPDWESKPFTRIEDAVVGRIDRPRGTVLLVDHRRDSRRGDAARLELWRPVVRGEGAVRSLLVLVDAPPERRANRQPGCAIGA
jgi:hypothetical protein